MTKALGGEAVVHLPRASNNAGHGSLRLAQRGKSFQVVISYRCYILRPGQKTRDSHERLSMVFFYPLAEKISCNIRAKPTNQREPE
ncbi:hypothetical protein D3OALGA1CA_4237 [Olavius algarvensis associated proteobacterium Delta 3]|nr:hypothetical protein D3OALGB2SA_4258 [Olavius algarvensis associated proteobacterium Delta 3]CAB5147687.1 hypothetical protein D3OALGA1CA_4237 [Olavius algarvensis associated proteobacterium Delta 3]